MDATRHGERALELIERIAEITPPELVVIRGADATFPDWRRAAESGYTPWRAVYCIPLEGVHTLPAYLPAPDTVGSERQTVAYVCSGLSCSLPIVTPEDLSEALRSRPGA